MSVVTLEKPDTEQIAAESNSLVKTCAEYAIVDQSTYADAGAYLTRIKTVKKRVDDLFDPAVKKAHAAHKELVALKKQFTGPLDNVEHKIKFGMQTWAQEQERIRREKEAEIRRQQEKADEERRLAEAEALEKAGKPEEAEAVLDQPAMVAPVVLPNAQPKIEGVSMREVWRFRIVDESKIPREFLIVDEKKLGAFARNMKQTANVPGVEFYSEKSVAARADY